MTAVPQSQMRAARLTKVRRAHALVLEACRDRAMRMAVSPDCSSNLTLVAVQHTVSDTPHRHSEAGTE